MKRSINPLRTLADLLYPRACAGCGRPVHGPDAALCPDCRLRVPAVSLPYCDICGDPVAGDVPGAYTCTWCRRTKPAFAWARSAVRYAGPVRPCIRNLKYHAGFWSLPEIEQWLAALWPTCPADARTADAIVPVPLHWTRRIRRTYNQATLVSGVLSRLSGIPVRPLWLWRLRRTGTQTHLTAAQRARNVSGVFGVPSRRAVRGRRIILVDDVMTTGATLNECARALRAAGAEAVMAITVARG